MKAKKVHEDFMDDLIGGPAALKTMAGWGKIHRKSHKRYTIKFESSTIITSDKQDYDQLVYLLKKYDVPLELESKGYTVDERI